MMGAKHLLCVGVTGHRDIATRYRDQIPTIRNNLSASFAAIRQFAFTVAESGKMTQPSLRLISPLAEGADRLAAELARDLGYRLSAALPFPQVEYERDFSAESRAEFRRFLAVAKREDGAIELAGSRNDMDAAYSVVGNYVISHSDLLVAVWDRSRPNLRGGTGDIVMGALGLGLPVIWISPRLQQPPSLLHRTTARPEGLPSLRPLADLALLLRGRLARPSGQSQAAKP
jgi:hypothetical protein